MPVDPYFQKIPFRLVTNAIIRDMNKMELFYFLRSQLRDAVTKQVHPKDELVIRAVYLRSQRPDVNVYIPRLSIRASARIPVGSRLIKTGLRPGNWFSHPTVTAVHIPSNAASDRGAVTIAGDRKFQHLYPVMGPNGPVLKGRKYINEPWYKLLSLPAATSSRNSSPQSTVSASTQVRIVNNNMTSNEHEIARILNTMRAGRDPRRV